MPWAQIASIGSKILGGVKTASAFLKANPAIGTAASFLANKSQTDSSYQRAMRDMKKAGLNPILAGKLGGAQSAVMGDLGQTSNTARQIDVTETKTKQEIENMKEDLVTKVSENVLKQGIADFLKTEQGKKLIPTLAAGGNALNPVTALMRWFTGPSGTELDGQLDNPKEVIKGVERVIKINRAPDFYPKD